MTCSSNDLPGSLKTSTRSVITTGPLAAMLMTRKSILSIPGAPGRMNEEIVLAITSLPVTGASGMLWYTASRSEEHTSELQSPDHLVCRLLLEKKKTNIVHTNGLSERTQALSV